MFCALVYLSALQNVRRIIPCDSYQMPHLPTSRQPVRQGVIQDNGIAIFVDYGNCLSFDLDLNCMVAVIRYIVPLYFHPRKLKLRLLVWTGKSNSNLEIYSSYKKINHKNKEKNKLRKIKGSNRHGNSKKIKQKSSDKFPMSFHPVIM